MFEKEQTNESYGKLNILDKNNKKIAGFLRQTYAKPEREEFCAFFYFVIDKNNKKKQQVF